MLRRYDSCFARMTMAALRPYEVMKMRRHRAAPPGPSSLTREPIWDLRDPGIGVAPRPWVPAFAGKTVGCGFRIRSGTTRGDGRLSKAEGSGGRGTGRCCRSDVDSSTSLRMTQRTLRLTVASLRIIVHALFRRYFFDTFLPVRFEVVHFRFEVPAEGVGRIDVCRPRFKDLLL